MSTEENENTGEEGETWLKLQNNLYRIMTLFIS